MCMCTQHFTKSNGTLNTYFKPQLLFYTKFMWVFSLVNFLLHNYIVIINEPTIFTQQSSIPNLIVIAKKVFLIIQTL